MIRITVSIALAVIAAFLAGSSTVQAEGRPRHAGPAFAQADTPGFRGGPGKGRGRGPRWREMGQQQRKHLEQFRLLKLLELLDLGEDQEVDFIRAFRNMRRERSRLHETRVELVHRLAVGLRSQALSDAEINSLVSDVSDLAARDRSVMNQFLTEMRSVLTPTQLGRFVVFHERFEFELLEALRAFRERHLSSDSSALPGDEPENQPGGSNEEDSQQR